MIRAMLLVLALVTGPVPLQAETPLPPQRPLQDRPDPDTTAQPPPYQAKLERLAELLGTLAFMRDLCGTGDGAAWRGKMSELLHAEGSTPERRDQLAGAFNRGFEDYGLTYRHCTTAAERVIGRALAEGEKISRDLSARYGS